MKILDNTKSLSTLVSDTSNGLGQIQPLSCVVTEELNGIYELDFTVNVNDKHYNDLKNSGLVKVTVGDGSEQIFRVFKVDEPIAMISSFHAQHITYDLSKVVVKPFTATGAVNIKNQLVSNMLGSYPFSTWTDITNTTSTFTNDIPRYFRECLGGYEGSVLDVLRPEYEWDNLTVKLHARRGADNGVRISYGKNLIDYSQEQNNENVYDGVYGYAVVDEVTYKADSYYNKTGATYPRILNVDFSSDYESGQIPTPSDLLQKATTYAQNNSIEVPSINIKIDFIPLWQTEEYKNILPLERVSLGDTVHVYFDKLNVEASSRVIKTQWNVLTEKYDSIELGDAKANLNTIISDSISTAVDEAVSNMDIDVGYIEEDLNNLADLITNGLGLFVTRDVLIDGSERIVLHNKPDVATSDVLYYIGANGLVVSTDGGQTWNAGFDSQGNAYFNALAANIIRALQIYGSTITFGDINDKYITASVYSIDNVAQGVSFDGSGTVRFRPQEQFLVYNKDPVTNKNYNMIVMNKSGSASQSYVELANYDDLHNFAMANYLEMDSHAGANNDTNQFYFGNYDTRSGSMVNGNSIVMLSSPTTKYVQLNNRQLNNGNNANFLGLSANAEKHELSFFNYQFGQTDKTANWVQLLTDSSGNSLNIYNYDYSNSTVTNSMEMASTKVTTLWSSNDLRLRSAGAVRIYANYTRTMSNQNDYTVTNGGTQDIWIGGYTVKLQMSSSGKLSLYWGSKRFNITAPSINVGASANLTVTREN